MKSYCLLLHLCFYSLFTIHCYSQDAEQIYKKVNDAVVTVYAYDSYRMGFENTITDGIVSG